MNQFQVIGKILSEVHILRNARGEEYCKFTVLPIPHLYVAYKNVNMSRVSPITLHAYDATARSLCETVFVGDIISTTGEITSFIDNYNEMRPSRRSINVIHCFWRIEKGSEKFCEYYQYKEPSDEEIEFIEIAPPKKDNF